MKFIFEFSPTLVFILLSSCALLLSCDASSSSSSSSSGSSSGSSFSSFSSGGSMVASSRSGTDSASSGPSGSSSSSSTDQNSSSTASSSSSSGVPLPPTPTAPPTPTNNNNDGLSSSSLSNAGRGGDGGNSTAVNETLCFIPEGYRAPFGPWDTAGIFFTIWSGAGTLIGLIIGAICSKAKGGESGGGGGTKTKEERVASAETVAKCIFGLPSFIFEIALLGTVTNNISTSIPICGHKEQCHLLTEQITDGRITLMWVGLVFYVIFKLCSVIIDFAGGAAVAGPEGDGGIAQAVVLKFLNPIGLPWAISATACPLLAIPAGSLTDEAGACINSTDGDQMINLAVAAVAVYCFLGGFFLCMVGFHGCQSDADKAAIERKGQCSLLQCGFWVVYGCLLFCGLFMGILAFSFGSGEDGGSYFWSYIKTAGLQQIWTIAALIGGFFWRF